MREIQRAFWVLLSAVIASSCLIDDECDAHQVKVEGVMAACECEPGYVIGPEKYGCVRCGKNEEAKSNECVCKEGFSRPTPTADCQRFVAGDLGTKCENDSECSADNPFCALSSDPGYCTTRDCEHSSDCPENWRCNTQSEPAFCEKAPAGLGMSCKTNADCTDSDAAYCEAFMSHTCMINECAQQPSKCLNGTVCCDLSALIGTSLCAPTSSLSGGQCVGGTDPITP